MSAKIKKSRINLREYLYHFKNYLIKPYQASANQLLRADESANLIPAPGFFVDDSGYVGVGTRIPEKPLHLVSENGAAAIRLETLVPSQNSTVQLKNTNQQFNISLDGMTEDDSLVVVDMNYGSIPFKIKKSSDTSSNNHALVIDGDGCIGVGTHEPSTQLHVNENTIDTSAKLTLSNSTNDTAWELVTRAASDQNFALNYVGGDEAEFVFSKEGGLTMLGQLTSSGIKQVDMDIPNSASDTGEKGTLVWDSDYLYICTETDTWKRTALSSW